MAAKSPFVTIKAECPVCETTNVFRYLKRRNYKVSRYDKDNFPLRYKWEDPSMSDIVPHHFYYWLCPECGFVAPEDDFRGKVLESKKFSLFREKLLQAQEDPALKVLKGLASGGTELETLSDAAVAVLIGIWQHELLSENMRDVGRLSRLCLRLSWLYRELAKVQRALFEPAVAESIKKVWPNYPAARREAVARAKHYYQAELGRNVREDDLKRRLTLRFLLAEFDMILGHVRESIQQANAIMKVAIVERNRANSIINGERVLNNKQYDLLKDRVRFLNKCIEDSKDYYKRAIKIIVKLETPKARKVFKDNEGFDREQMSKLLEKSGFHKEVIQVVLKENFDE